MCDLADDSLTHLVIANGMDTSSLPTNVPSRTHIVKQQVGEGGREGRREGGGEREGGRERERKRGGHIFMCISGSGRVFRLKPALMKLSTMLR